MIIFEKLRYKNFLSTGNKQIEIDLNNASATLVVGSNGAGKSTMLDALSFGLFGKPHRNINKTQLVNSINNKATEVEVEFKIGPNNFKVSRGIKPTRFEVYQNGNLLNQESHSRDYQKILENNILKLNHKSFHQVVVLGSSNFVPFMQLPSHQRRTVIEDLLDIGVFTTMNTLVKERSAKLKQQIIKTQSDIRICEESIRLQKKHIKQLQQIDLNQATKNQKKIDELESEKELLIKRNEEIHDNYTEKEPYLSGDIKAVSTKEKTVSSELRENEFTVKGLIKKDKFLADNEVCPTCSQAIDSDFAASERNKLKEESDKYLKEISKLGVIKNELIRELKEIKEKHSLLTSTLSDIRINDSTIANIDAQVKRLSSVEETQSIDTTKAERELNTQNENFKELSKTSTGQTSIKAYIDAIFELLKDTGIKTKVIRQYLPVMNKLINQYLQILDFFVSFTLDESFNETIKSRYRDEFSYASFSEGEKQRIDLALLFSWRQVARMKNSANTNLLMLDETFDSSLDAEGVDNLLKILYTLKKDTNVFIISHKQDMLDGKFPAKLTFSKQNNFSYCTSS
jgi:DNA repair exonuclease SbcCD ATPase subunit